MTRYTVLWDQDVESQFIEAWAGSDSATRQALTEVANWVDANLTVDPHLKGIAKADLSVHFTAVPLQSSPARVSVAYQILGDAAFLQLG